MLEQASAELSAVQLDSFRQGLREFGYVEGRNLLINYRSADGHPERFPALADDLVRGVPPLPPQGWARSQGGRRLDVRHSLRAHDAAFCGDHQSISKKAFHTTPRRGRRVDECVTGRAQLKVRFRGKAENICSI
jgi:hypothetical protein